MRACFVVLGAIACGFVLAETAEPVESNPFVPSIQSIPQLIASQEIQRRWADVVLGTAQAYQWLSYASIEGRKAEQANAVKGSLEETMDSHDLTKAAALENSPFRAAANDDDDDDVAAGDNSVNANDDDDDDVSMLELKSGFTPFMGGMGMGMGYGGYGMPFGGFGGFYPSAAPAASTPAAPASPMDLEEQSTAAKQNALKYMQIQLYLVANDVEKTYWVNKILASLLPPQLMYMKLYKQYLTTLGLGLAFQLHDAFTLESRLDDFNDHYLSTATPGTTLKSEAVAEVQVYSNWYSLAMIKMQLFYISMYERSMMSGIQRQATNGAFQSASSFLELKADPETPFAGVMGNQGMLAQQYAAFSQYLSLMRLYIMFSETSLASTGLMAASTKSKSVDMAFDKDPSNDGEAGKLRTQAAAIETQWLPRLFQQWATTTLIKFQLEQFLLIMDVQIPQLLAARVAERADSSLQDMNLVQTDASTTTPAAAN